MPVQAPLVVLRRAWASLPLRAKGLVVIAIPLGALLVTTLLTHLINRQHTAAERWVSHTHEVRLEVQEVFTLVEEAASGVRGYLLTGAPSFLAPYELARRGLPASLDGLAVLVRDNPDQLARARRVRRLAREQLAALEALRVTASERPPEALRGRLVASKAQLDALRRTLRAMTAEEERLLEARTAWLRRAERWQRLALLASVLLGIGGGLVAVLLFTAGIARRAEYVEANAKRLAAGEPLLPPVPGGDELSRLGVSLRETAEVLASRTRELRESEARLRSVVSGAPIVLYALDSGGVFVFSEGEGLGALGHKSGELVGKSIFEVYGDAPQVLENNRRALAGERFSAPVKVGERVFEVQYSPRLEGGRLAGVIAVATDVTERKRAEEVLLGYQRTLEQQNVELERASRLKSDFLANMSHELRTPLTAVLGFSELLKEELFGPLNDKQRAYAADIFEAGSHLLALINDLLDLSKIEAGKMELERGPVSLPEAVADALAVLEGQVRKKELHLDAELPPTMAPLSADARKVRQILYNLLSNAVKFTPAEGSVQLLVQDGEGEVRVEVRDTGPGIPEEDQGRLFEAFTRLDSPVTRQVGGTGLGLALTKRLVELHGGRVWLRSRVGEGSTFGFSLPRRPSGGGAVYTRTSS